ncbi:MAG TPA: DUF4349 domain-containing protein [Polyangiaceae bacterium]|jgi:hypothetical protein
MLLRICQSALLLVLGTGCGGGIALSTRAKSADAAPAESPTNTSTQANAPASDGQRPEVALAAPPPNAVPSTAALQGAPPAPPGGAPAGASAANGASTEADARQMLEIEAWFALTVPNVSEALRALHALARERGGFVADEEVSGAGAERATLTLRIPSGSAEPFFEAARKLGDVDSERMNVRDVGKEYHDATILLENLRAALHRYEEILAKAQNVEEIMKVESELTRIRGEIERVEGSLRWLRDRAAQATVHVTLTRKGSTVVEPDRAVAKLYPGVRFGYLADYRGQRGGAGYLGGGLSLRGSRAISLDVEGLRDATRDTRGLDIFQITIGGEDYSDFLGGGRRQWLNPYLGLRAGYARFLGYGEAVAGGTLGVEVLHTQYVTLDADFRLLGYFFGTPSAHIAAQPALGVNVAF